LFEALATKWVGERGMTATLGIGKTEPPIAELRFENAIFFE
jgi:hypothetical protein